MNNLIHKPIILLILIHLFSIVTNFITAQTNTNPTTLEINPSNSTFSPWLFGTGRGRWGCRRRPWICDQPGDSPPTRRLCCRNRCVEVDSDPNNCGFCGIRCPFTWQCCRGNCTNINSDTSNCGACGNKCEGNCVYGLCGYGGDPEPPSSDPCPPWRRHRRHRPCPRPFPPRQGGKGPGRPPIE